MCSCSTATRCGTHIAGSVPRAVPAWADSHLSPCAHSLDPRAQDIAPGTGNFAYSVIHNPSFQWTDGGFTPPGPSKAIIYEMHIPSFTQNGGSMGTFSSAAAKLPYLQKLGINMIELMPVATFCDQADGWGYNPCAPFAAMQAFGGADGLKSFVNAAAQHNIGVMLDVVRVTCICSW
mgnify:CR=1 FL=1